ncbi:hypothetical protein V3C99_001254 [Haemonchus contortus]
MMGRIVSALNFSNSGDEGEGQDKQPTKTEETTSTYSSESDEPKKVKKKRSKSPSSKHKPPKARVRGNVNPFVERWITASFRLRIQSATTCENEIFAPISSMCALYAVTQALPKFRRESIREMVDFDANCLRELGNAIASQPRLPPCIMFSFVKIIVNDDDKTRVSGNLTNKMKQLTKTEVIMACTPQRTGRFLESLSAGAVSGPRSTHGLTTVYTAAGLTARWCGKSTRADPSAFISSYSIRQMHPFIQLETIAKRISMNNCEIWQIPLQAGRTVFHLCLIRPYFIGDIVKLKSQMRGEDLKDIFDELLEAKGKLHKILLPEFSLTAEEDMFNIWLRKGSTYVMESSNALPPFNAIWNVSKMSLTTEGIGVKDLKLESCPRLPQSYPHGCTADMYHKHTSFAAAINSTFLFVVTVKEILPLLAGCYAGHPAPTNCAYTVLATERIRKKPPPVIEARPKVKLTKKQKKCLKVRRKRAARMKKRVEKFRKEAEKHKTEMLKKANEAVNLP